MAGRATLLFLSLGASMYMVGDARGDVTVEKAWEEKGVGHAIISYANDTDITFSTIKIICTAFTEEEKLIRKTSTYVSNHLGGGVTPGHSITREIKFRLSGEKIGSVNCEVMGNPYVGSDKDVPATKPGTGYIKNDAQIPVPESGTSYTGGDAPIPAPK